MKFKYLIFVFVISFSRNSFSQTVECSGVYYEGIQIFLDGCIANHAPIIWTEQLDGPQFLLQCARDPDVITWNYSGSKYVWKECYSGYTPSVKKAVENPKPQCSQGSIVYSSTQVVGETIPLVGASFNLSYFSNQVLGRKADYRSNIAITGSSVPPTSTAINLNIKNELGSTVISNNYATTTNQSYLYEWNGLDANSNETWGPIQKTITIHESSSGFQMPDNPYTIFLGNLKAEKLGIGGWLPSIWHFYHAASSTLYSADGTSRKVTGVADGIYTRIANESGSEVYYFDSTGKIIFTKTGLTGSTRFTFAYDSSGRLLIITEPFNKVTTFTRSSGGVLQSITAPNGKITTISINANGYLSQVTNPLNEIYSMTYYGTTGGLLNTFTVPSGDITTLTYDTDGNLITDSHSNGFSATLAKTSTSVTNTSSLGRVTSTVFDASFGNETTTRPSGYQSIAVNSGMQTNINSPNLIENITYQAHPRFGDQAQRISSNYSENFGGRSSTFTNITNLTDTSNPFSIDSIIDTETIGSSTNTSTYNGLTLTTNFTSTLGKTGLVQVDQYERPILAKIGNLTARAYTYTNNLLTNIVEGARSNTLAYNTLGLLQSVTNSLSQTTSFTYDAAQRLKTTTLPDLRVITYNYDYNGNLTSLTPPLRSNVNPTGLTPHSMVYGTKDKLTSYAPPTLSGVATVNTTYTYNNDKQLTKITRPDGKIINLNYNATTGLMDSISGAFGTINKTYTDDNPSSIDGLYGDNLYIGYYRGTPYYLAYTKDSTSIYSYIRMPSADPVGGKVGTETINGMGSGSVQRIINYAYDDDEYLTGVGDLTLAYNTPNGQLTGTTLGNITDAYTYNSFGEIASYEAKYNTTSIYKYVLTRDAIGRVSQKVETLNSVVKTFVYTYDNSGRLIQVTTNGTVTATYSYDENSNRSGGTIGGVATIATYDRQDRLTNYNGTALTYNANGEILTKGTASFVYDYFGNLQSHINGTTAITYEIDPNQRRLGRKVNGVLANRYIYNPEGQIVGQLDNTNKLIKTFVYGSKSHVPDYFIDANNNKFRIITDYLGSVRLVVSSTGVVMQRMEHDEFGKVIQDTSLGYTPFGFAGGLYESASGLVRFGARDYDPQIGRWLSKDPIGFNGGDTNLYGYVIQDPINFIDPSGLARGDWWDPRTYTMPVVEAGQGTIDFMVNYRNMRSANTIGADKYFHCMASCQATQRGPGGAGAAIGIGEGRELFDEYIKGDSAGACNADRAANSQGRAGGSSGGSCSQSCNSLRPGGLGAQW